MAVLHPLLGSLLRQKAVFDIAKMAILFAKTDKPIPQV
jgi:hypothetical protein